MRLALFVALTAICGVTVYRRLARESMKKDTHFDHVSPEWLIENVYKEGKAS